MPTGQLKMTDLEADAARVYADNYPGDTRQLEPKRAWWKRIL